MAHAENSTPTGLFDSRGFKVGHCYQHHGKLTCTKSDNCNLDVFSQAHKLSFESNFTDLKKILPSEVRGHFSFKVIATEPIAKIEIFSQRSTDTKEGSTSLDDRIGMAHEVPCKSQSSD
jgi:hypothetical protein